MRWKVVFTPDKCNGACKALLKEKVWLGTYHTPINAAVHHDFYKVVLAVEGCIFTSTEIPTCAAPAGKKKSHKLKLNFSIDDLPALMFKSVKFSQLWNRHKQDAERYIFRSLAPARVQAMVQDMIEQHCGALKEYIAANDTVRRPCQCKLSCGPLYPLVVDKKFTIRSCTTRRQLQCA